jgi:plastocyanin
MDDDRSRSRGGMYAAAAVVAVTAGLGIVGVAWAADDQTITADDGTVFTPSQVNISVGDSVTWTFDNPTNQHNVIAKADSPTAWSTGDGQWSLNHDDVGPIEFTAEGTYTFYCQVHPGMEGTVIVGAGAPPPPPPASPPPPSDTTITTPAPGGETGDSVKPTVRRVSTETLRRGVRVRFRLSEPATVTVRVKRARRVVKSARVQAAAGTRTVTLRSKRLKKGRYTVEIDARDASGNRSRLATKRVTLRR